MSERLLLEIVLPVSILAQLGAALVAIRLIRITGKPMAWSLIAAGLACMTVRRIMLFELLLDGDASGVNRTSELIGLLISFFLLAGMCLTSSIFKSMRSAREKLDLASRRLQDASAAGRVVLWEWNIETGVREWSSLVDELLGFPPDGFPREHRAWEARIHPDDLQDVRDAMHRNFETSAPYDVTYRIQRTDGVYAWWHEVGHVNRDREGTPVSIAGASVDVTERKQHEAEYATIIQTAVDGFAIFDAGTGRLVDVNDAYCRLLGYTRTELLGLRMTDLTADPASIELTEHVKWMIQIGRDQFEIRLRRKDGQPVDVAVSGQYLANAGRICAFISDISERKHHEAALQTRLAEIERFNLLTTKREQRMIALKEEVNQLAQALGRAPPYVGLLDELDDAGAAADASPKSEMLLQELHQQREAALNLVQDTLEARRLLEASEDALRQSHDMLEHVLNSVPQAVFWKDRNSVYLGCNRVFAQMLGLNSSQEVVGKTDFDLVTSHEQAERYRTDDREVMDHSRIKQHIIEAVIRHDGAQIWVDTTKLPLVDADGQVYGVLGVYEDITERKREEAFMRQSKEHLQLALIAIEDAIWDWVPPRNTLFWSPRLFAMLGYLADEFTPTMAVWESLLHPEDQSAAKTMLQQCIAGERDDYQIDVRFRTKSGNWFWVLVRGRVLARGLQGEILRMAGTHTDISERKQNEELIHQQLDELQRWQAVMIGREQRTIELKQEVNALLQRLGEPVRYASVEQDDIA